MVFKMKQEEIDSQKWFDNQAPVYDQTETLNYHVI